MKRRMARVLAMVMAFVLMGTSTNVTAFAAGICDHHLEHTAGCGYVEAVEGADCTHEHGNECYSEVVECVHEHDENCGYAEGSCTHVCSKESRCITTKENCNHSHDENCGYVQAQEGTPCSFVCDVCEAEASDEDDEDAVCICEDKCTGDTVNEECPVCSLEEADLALCAGEEAEDEEVTCICTDKCMEDSVNEECPVCFAENADLNNCIGEVEEMQSIITAWSFIDEYECIDLETNTLALPGASAENVALKSDVISLLPTSIVATVNETEENITLSGWECEDYPETGAYAGTYTFTATLPVGYTLGEEVSELTVNVELGGAIVYDTRAGVCIHENPAVNNDSTINDTTYVCDVCGLFGYIGSPNVYDVSWELEDNGDSTYTLRIKGTGTTADYDRDWDSAEKRYYGLTPWEPYKYSITQAVVEDGITGLGVYILSGTNIKSIDLGKDIKSIGDNAFRSCTKLENVALPHGLTTIGMSAFCECKAMTSCSIPTTVTEIKDNSFRSCSSLASISLPYSLEKISRTTFAYCSKLTNITLAEGITEIGACAFESCPLTSIEIPGTVKTIDESAFYGCKELTRAQLNEGVETIGVQAFYKCEKLQEVILPTTIKDIGYRAFEYCSSLESINLQGLTSIGEYAFGNSGLTEVTIPGTVTTIPSLAFFECENLETVVIEQGVTGIGEKAFQYCNNIKTLRIPSSLASVGDDAFLNNVFDTIYVPCNATLDNLNSLFINTSLRFSETNGELSCNNWGNAPSFPVVKGTHDFSAGECDNVVSCANGCGESGTNPAGHAFADATCTTAQTCSRCLTTQGSALGHAMSPWVVVGDNHTHECLRDGCDFEETQAHNGGEATCVAKAVCSTCGTEYGDKNLNNHTFVEATCLEAKHCTRTGCDFVDGAPLPHVYVYTIDGSKLKEHCPNGCYHLQTAELKIKDGVNLTYSGRPITPLELVYSDDWRDSSTPEIAYLNNINAGTAKGSVTFTIDGNDYTIEKTFTIKPLITISDNDDSDDEDDTPTWTVTIAKVEPKLPVLETYVVKAGDTLSKIAAMYGCTVNDIMQYNSTLIKNPNLIYVGWELTIPVGGIVNEPVTNTAGNTLYVVQSGDTLYAIAKKYRCSVKDIVELNSKLIKNPNLIYTGWELVIPQ